MVEECEALSTSDLPAIDSWIKDVPLIGPKITLQIGERQTRDATIEVVLKSRGKFIRRYFKCPHCHSPGRPCIARQSPKYLPAASAGDWSTPANATAESIRSALLRPQESERASCTIRSASRTGRDRSRAG